MSCGLSTVVFFKLCYPLHKVVFFFVLFALPSFGFWFCGPETILAGC